MPCAGGSIRCITCLSASPTNSARSSRGWRRRRPPPWGRGGHLGVLCVSRPLNRPRRVGGGGGGGAAHRGGGGGGGGHGHVGGGRRRPRRGTRPAPPGRAPPRGGPRRAARR